MFGDPVLNEMGWEKHALKEFGIWKSGGTPKKNEEKYFRGHIPWITSGELEHKYIDDSFEKITEKAIECSSAKIIEKGSLLLGMYDTAGLKSSINTKVMSCNQAIAFAKLDDKITNTIYVYYVIQNLRSMLLNQQRGVRQKNFNLSMIKNIAIPLPPLSLQNEFADFVAQVDKSQFNEMFGDPVLNEMGWEKHALKEFGIWKSGGTPKKNEEKYFRGHIPWITSGELEHKYIDDSFEKITEKAIECSSAKIIEKGSLLLGMYDTAGLKSSINTKVMSCNQAIAFAKLDDKITNTIYVYYVIQNLRSMLLNQQRGVRQKNFNLSMIKNIAIPLPPLSLQNEFADFVAQVDKSQFACQMAIKLWRNSLKSSII